MKDKSEMRREKGKSWNRKGEFSLLHFTLILAPAAAVDLAVCQQNTLATDLGPYSPQTHFG